MEYVVVPRVQRQLSDCVIIGGLFIMTKKYLISVNDGTQARNEKMVFTFVSPEDTQKQLIYVEEIYSNDLAVVAKFNLFI